MHGHGTATSPSYSSFQNTSTPILKYSSTCRRSGQRGALHWQGQVVTSTQSTQELCCQKLMWRFLYCTGCILLPPPKALHVHDWSPERWGTSLQQPYSMLSLAFLNYCSPSSEGERSLLHAPGTFLEDDLHITATLSDGQDIVSFFSVRRHLQNLSEIMQLKVIIDLRHRYFGSERCKFNMTVGHYRWQGSGIVVISRRRISLFQIWGSASIEPQIRKSGRVAKSSGQHFSRSEVPPR